jgi:deazaflavin-dependent oxidoreductase (nitroreductase family)
MSEAHSLALADEAYCYLTTTGRVTGNPHTIEIWFALRDENLYLISGGGESADWVRNLLEQPRVRVSITEMSFDATARVVTDADEGTTARRLLLDKYSPGYAGDLSDWGTNGLPIAIDLDEAPPRDL